MIKLYHLLQITAGQASCLVCSFWVLDEHRQRPVRWLL